MGVRISLPGPPKLAERTVDDFLFQHQVEHEVEPRYPGSTRGADWRLADGTLVEYAGLLTDADYAGKIAAKRPLASTSGLQLVILVPEDLPNLGRALAAWFPP